MARLSMELAQTPPSSARENVSRLVGEGIARGAEPTREIPTQPFFHPMCGITAFFSRKTPATADSLQRATAAPAGPTTKANGCRLTGAWASVTRD